MQRRAGASDVEHELVEIGTVTDGALDVLVDVLRRVLFKPMIVDPRKGCRETEPPNQLKRVAPGELRILAFSLSTPSRSRRTPRAMSAHGVDSIRRRNEA